MNELLCMLRTKSVRKMGGDLDVVICFYENWKFHFSFDESFNW